MKLFIYRQTRIKGEVVKIGDTVAVSDKREAELLIRTNKAFKEGSKEHADFLEKTKAKSPAKNTAKTTKNEDNAS
jgi:hypothetical protein